MQDEDPVHRAHEHVVDLVFLGRHAEHHAHEVRGVGKLVARVHERLADRVLVGHRDDGGHLRDQPEGADRAVLGIVDVERVVVERRQRADHADHHGHRVRVAPEPLVEARQLLVHHGVVRHRAHEFGLLPGVRQLAVQQQVAGLEEVAVLRELLDRVAAVQQHAGVAVDVGDRRVAARRRQEARVVGEHAGFPVQRADVHHVGPDAPGHHRELEALAVGQGQRRFLVHVRSFFSRRRDSSAPLMRRECAPRSLQAWPRSGRCGR
jgi:hypothetical protein